MRYLLPVGLILIGLYIGFAMFQIPICMKMGWYRRGEQLIEGALQRIGESPAVVPLLFHLFVFQFQQGRLAEATATLDRLSREDLPSDAVPVMELNRAGLLVADEEFQKALDIYMRYSVEDFPEKQQAVFLNNLAFSYFTLGIELEIGIELADRAFNMSPDPRFAKTLAGLLLKTGSLEAALAWCEYGLRRLKRADHISRAWCYYLLALTRQEMGQTAGARDAVQKGLAVCPLEKLSRRMDSLTSSL